MLEPLPAPRPLPPPPPMPLLDSSPVAPLRAARTSATLPAPAAPNLHTAEAWTGVRGVRASPAVASEHNGRAVRNCTCGHTPPDVRFCKARVLWTKARQCKQARCAHHHPRSTAQTWRRCSLPLQLRVVGVGQAALVGVLLAALRAMSAAMRGVAGAAGDAEAAPPRAGGHDFLAPEDLLEAVRRVVLPAELVAPRVAGPAEVEVNAHLAGEARPGQRASLAAVADVAHVHHLVDTKSLQLPHVPGR
mmetsp:Transcript_36329/g.98343  ORF Transcript_36329/g.98343 Transcript_36329/m.98343 type:complete len:247 (+) Transcript_36329:134-874(+)